MRHKAPPRTLILGFDGGDSQVFSAFDMPFLESIRRAGHTVDVCEDLLTRGWSEILTGCTAEDTAGLHFHPIASDKKPVLEDKYSLRQMLANPEVKAIWALLNERGIRFGMMGVPTTSPAPKLDGFVVSGGGGGKGKIDGLPEGYFYPEEIESVLLEAKYEFDVRLSTMAENSFADFVRRVEEVVDSNVKALKGLNDMVPADAIFICLRPTTGLQYLARYDIEQATLARQHSKPLTGNAKLLADHYRFLDNQIRRIFEIVQPERFILVADHGTQRYLKRLNLNAFLIETGYQRTTTPSARAFKSLLRAAKHILPRSISTKYSKNVRRKLAGTVLNFDHTATRAFGHYHVPGIYINDAERFGGPVQTHEVDALVDELCVVLNESPVLKNEGFEARSFRRRYRGSYAERELPDIEVFGPDTHFFMGTGPLLSDNPNYRETPADLKFVHNPYSGVKGRNPILCMDRETAALVAESDARNMTLAYKLLDRIYAQ